MPGYKTHLLGGILLGISLLVIFRATGSIAASELPELFCALLLGSLFPDIDTRSMGRRFGTLILLLIAASAAALSYLLIAYGIIAFLVLLIMQPHRGITHRVAPWLLVCAGTVCMIALFSFPCSRRMLHALIFFGVGLFSHLVLDGRLLRIRRRRRR
jgi:membrane-bound metal-dependent hydrolase YbcI (DUF457 family)